MAVKVTKEKIDPAKRGAVVHELRHESEMLSRLEHPALPEHYGAGETEEGCYTAMEFIDGPDLLSVLEDQETFLPEQQVSDGQSRSAIS